MADEMDFDKLGEYEDEDVGVRPEDKRHARSNNEEWFKGEKNVAYRVSFLYFWPLAVAIALAAKKRAKDKGEAPPTNDVLTELVKKTLTKRSEDLNKPLDQLQEHEKLDLSEIHFKKIIAHYKDGVGFVVSRLGKDGSEADEVWKMLGDAKPYFCTPLLVYATNRQGELDKAQFATGWKVVPWRTSSKVYTAILAQANSLRSNDLTIADQDLVITCTNSEYQNFDKIESAGKALYRKNPKLQDSVLSAAVKLYPKLTPFRELSTADLRIKLGLSTAARGEDVSNDDMDDLLNSV